MKKILTSAAVATLLFSSALVASDSNSLIAIEGGFSPIKYETETKDVTTNAIGVGVKIGAETKDYRMFLSGRKLQIDKFSRSSSYGLEFQYKLELGKYMNIFAGIGAGKANLQLENGGDRRGEKISSRYYGGDTGINIHMGESFDLEMGMRYMSIEDIPKELDVKSVMTGYGSIIYKYQMD